MRISKNKNGSMCISEGGDYELIPCEGFELDNLTKVDSNGNMLYLFEYTKDKCIITQNEKYSEWFESDKLFEIKMSYENQSIMLESYPEFGTYRKDNNIPVYRKDDYVYFYVNYFLGQHRQLLNNFGAIINEK